MMTPEPHPDQLLHESQVKKITRGGRQAATDAAMDAMWEAIEAGNSREEFEKVFSETYIKVLHGKQ
jgi:hypothetical protein